VPRVSVETLNGRLRLIACDSGMTSQYGYDAAALWEILVDTVHALPMYKHHKHYAEKSVLPEKSRISAKEMALLMGMPLGEAIVILEELRPSSKGTREDDSKSKVVAGKSLLDYGIK
jgi:RNAse (barnase) inhibitor barstar